MIRYSGQDFDSAQHVARVLTDELRAAGRSAPAYGYSGEAFAAADAACRALPWHVECTPAAILPGARERLNEAIGPLPGDHPSGLGYLSAEDFE